MKKLADPVRKVNTQCVGLDVHKNLTVFCLLDGEGKTTREERMASTREAFEALVHEVLKSGPAHFTFEASRSSLWVHGLLTEMVGPEFVHVAQAAKIRAIANTNAKNDERDAWWLAYLTYEGRLPEAHVPSGSILDLRIATRERAVAVRTRTKTINRLKAHFAQVGKIVPSSTVRTEVAILFMAKAGLATEGVRGQAIRGCLGDLDYQDAAIKEWEDVIDQLIVDLPAVDLIAKEIPGIGKILAATIVAEAGDIRRFHSAKAFGCATGLTPSDHSTSGKTKHGDITREGSPHLRWAMTQAAMGCLRSRRGAGLAVGNWIRTKEKRMGVKAKARAAGGRKLSESIWRLFQYGELFDAGRAFGSRGVSK
jgi:transposase